MQDTFPTPVTAKGTLGRVYGGDEGLVHIADGTRGSFGQDIADFIDREMRDRQIDAGDKPLCPGCYMIALIGAAMTLAERNGQSMAEMGRSMSHAFTQVAELADASEVMALPEEMLIKPFAEATSAYQAATIPPSRQLTHLTA